MNLLQIKSFDEFQAFMYDKHPTVSDEELFDVVGWIATQNNEQYLEYLWDHVMSPRQHGLMQEVIATLFEDDELVTLFNKLDSHVAETQADALSFDTGIDCADEPFKKDNSTIAKLVREAIAEDDESADIASKSEDTKFAFDDNSYSFGF